TGELRGSTRLSGTPAQIVRVQPPESYPIDAYVEPSSGRLLRAVIDPNGLPTTIDILNYADLDGKKIISSWHIGSEITTTDVEHTAIVNADFHPPAQRASWSFGPLQPIPIAFSGGRMWIRAAVNGVAGDFMLDTAAISIFLNPSFAKRARVKDIGGIANVDALEVGGNVLHNVRVRTKLDARGPLQDFDGLLGFDFLAGAIVDVDTAKAELTIYDPAHYAVTASGPPVVLDLRSGQARVPVTLNGRVKGHFLFDTGETTAVVATEKLYGPPRGVEMRTESTAQFNSAPVNCGRLQRIEIGGALRYDNVPACFGDYTELFGSDGGVIGLDFLKRFDLTFDYPEAVVYLTPLKQ
ncbi:MAG: aspartyl protease family protein, partial [Vulcanimicrobiaceae bacterium]